MSARDELATVIVTAYGEDAEVECPCEQDLDVADAIIAAGYRKLEPAWLGSLEHNETHEFVNTSHCDGEHIARWRRTPELSLTVKAGPWEIVEPETQP